MSGVRLADMRRCPSCGGLTYHAVCLDCGVETYVGVPVGSFPPESIEWLTFKPGESPRDEDDEVWAVTDSKAALDAARLREQLGPWPGPIDGPRGGGACYS